MAERIIDTSQLTAEANTIRAKGVTGLIEYKENGFADAIASIPSGGITPTGTIDILANGLVDVTNYASANVNVSAGGGSLPEHGVFFIDYDGSVVTAWVTSEVASKATLPDNPAHTGLIAQGWNWSLPNIQSYIADYPTAKVYVGQVYNTASHLTEIDITITKFTGKTVTCNMSGNKNWGDGTTDNTTSHTYDDYGDYTITCNGTSIPAGTSSSGGMFGSNTSNVNRSWCTAIRIGENVTSIGKYAFYYCYSLTNITIPESVTSIGDYVFSYCYSLTNITIPESVTSISSSAFRYCYSLTNITIPESVTSIGTYSFYNCYSLTNITIPANVDRIGDVTFQNCYSLTNITLPENVERIGGNAFYNCYSLTNITIPEGVTRIYDSAFYNCYSLIYYDFSTLDAIPTLNDSNAFNNINNICKIIIPDALYDSWKIATNWTTYSNYIYKASEVAV